MNSDTIWLPLLLLLSAVFINGCASQQNLETSSCPDLEGIEAYAGSSELAGRFIISDTGEQLFNGWQVRGTYIQLGDIFTPCVKGSKAGENVNYYYCRDMTARKIDAGGNIVGTKDVTVVLSLFYDGTLKKTTTKNYISTTC